MLGHSAVYPAIRQRAGYAHLRQGTFFYTCRLVWALLYTQPGEGPQRQGSPASLSTSPWQPGKCSKATCIALGLTASWFLL